jgi:hypothetical protein
MTSSPEAIIRSHASLRVVDGAERTDTDWRSRLIAKHNGDPRSLLANVITALRLAPEWAGVLGYDAFSVKTMALSARPWEKGRNSADGPRSWTTRDDVLTANSPTVRT